MQKYLIQFIFLVILLAACDRDPVRIACVGDSITEGAGTTSQSRFAWPVKLDSLLGEGYAVLNCGRSGATMLKQSNLSYWDCNEFSNIFEFQPQKVIIKLGTNDSKPFNWNQDAFKQDYKSMIDTLLNIHPEPDIFLCLPVPAYKEAWGIRDSVIAAGVIPIIRQLATEYKLKTIDLNTGLSNLPEFFPDGIHPDNQGAARIAEIVADAIRGK